MGRRPFRSCRRPVRHARILNRFDVGGITAVHVFWMCFAGPYSILREGRDAPAVPISQQRQEKQQAVHGGGKWSYMDDDSAS